MATSLALVMAWLAPVSQILPLLLDAAVKGVAVIAAAFIATRAMRRRSAAARQMVWFLSLAGLLALPGLSVTLPEWQVLPKWARLDLATLRERGGAESFSPGADPSKGALQLQNADNTANANATAIPVFSPKERAGATSVDPQPDRAAALPTIPPRATSAAPSSSQSLLNAVPLAVWLTLVWAVGIVACLLPIALGHLSLMRLKRGSRRIAEGAWPALLEKTISELNLARRPILLESNQRTMPMIWGILRPYLLLPANSEAWPAERRRVVLLHELAHVKRWDCLTKLIAHIACAVYWFNPLAWMAFKRLQIEAEQACDDLVLASGCKASDYAEDILQIASGLQAGFLAAHNGIAMAGSGKLEGRLLAILDHTRSRGKLTALGALLAGLLILSVIVPLAILKSGEGSGGWGVSGLIKQLGSEQEAVWRPAAVKLIKKGPSVAEPVAAVFDNGGPGDAHAEQVLEAMASEPRVQEIMLKGLSSSDSNTRHCSLMVLGKSGNRQHVPQIAALLPQHAVPAAIALGQLGGDESFKALAEGLEYAPTQYRWVVAEQIATFRRPEAVAALEKAMTQITSEGLATAYRYVAAIHKARNDKSASELSMLRSVPLHALGNANWINLEAWSFAENSNVLVQAFHRSATEGDTRAKAMQALVAKPKADLAWDNQGSARLLALHELQLAPFRPTLPKNWDIWTDLHRFYSQQELIKQVKAYNESPEAPRPLNGVRIYPFKQDDLFLVLTRDGKLGMIRTAAIDDQTNGGMRYISMQMSVKTLDPLYALIPTQAYGVAAEKSPGASPSAASPSASSVTTATNAPPAIPVRLPSAAMLPSAQAAPPPSRLDTINAVLIAKQQAGELRERIQQQSDKPKRARALQELLAMLDGAGDARLKALATLGELRDVPFDRAPYAERARKALKDDAPAMRAAALIALGAIGEAPGDLDAMAALVDDSSETVREFLPQALCAPGKGETPEIIIVTLGRLLNDPSPDVIRAAIGMLWARPFTPAMEQRLIELSRNRDYEDSVIYFALSTQLDKSEAVCRRLIEAMETPGNRENQERAAWGLGHFAVAPEARDKIVAAFIRAYDESTNSYIRSESIFGLGRHATQAAASKLRDIAANDENQAMRKLAGDALVRAKIDVAGPSTASTPSTQSTPPPASRPASSLSGRELTQDLLARIQQQKDREKRQNALDELLARLDGVLPGKLEAMETLSKLKEIPFDRRPYLDRVRMALKDSAPATRQASLKALGAIGEKETDLPSLVALTDDPDPIVRALLTSSLYQLAGANPPEAVLNAVAKLLSDKADVVVRTTFKSLWGNPLNAAGEKRLIELSRTAPIKDEVIYYALSTLPKKSELVSRRLIEELETSSSLHQDRAAWGLSHFEATPDARDLVVAALIRAFDNFSNPYVRENCVYGLGQHATEAAIAKLRVIAEKDEIAKTRKAATEALDRALRKK